MESKKPMSYSCKSIRPINALLIILMGCMFFAWVVGTSMADPVFGPPFQIPTGCGDNQAEVMELTEGDYPQDAAWQDQRWEQMKADFPGLVDSDRLGNASWTYNCHSYIFNNSQYWLNDPSPYKGTSSGCYKEDPNGTIRSEGTRHSCTVDYLGKCGSMFLMKRNELVYGSVNPIYKKLTAPIPTLSEWKQIFLTLLMLAMGMSFVRRRQPEIMSGGSGTLQLAEDMKPSLFEAGVFSKVMVWIMMLVVLTFGVITLLFGSVSMLDIVGTLFCAPLLGYILHLLILGAKDFQRGGSRYVSGS